MCHGHKTPLLGLSRDSHPPGSKDSKKHYNDSGRSLFGYGGTLPCLLYRHCPCESAR